MVKSSSTLVVGPGRCGTSLVARHLHERGVNMGRILVPGNDSNPDGHFEDAEFHWLNQGRLIERLGLVAWCAGVEALIAERTEPWGLKDPRTAEFIEDYLELLPDARIIRCRRDRGEIIASCCHWYGWRLAQAADLVDRREGNLDRALDGRDVTDFICGETRLEDIHA